MSLEGFDPDEALAKGAVGAVGGAVTGATAGAILGTIGGGATVMSIEGLAAMITAGPLGGAAAITFKELTGRDADAVDAMGIFHRMIPLPTSEFLGFLGRLGLGTLQEMFRQQNAGLDAPVRAPVGGK